MKRIFNLFSVALVGFLWIYWLSTHSLAYAANKVVRVPVDMDAYVEEGYPNTITHAQRNLYVGYSTIYNKKRTRTYIVPNYDVLRSAGIEPQDIVQARLFLYLYQWQGTSSIQVNIYRVLQTINPAALVWSNQPNIVYSTYNIVDLFEGFKELRLTSAFTTQYEYFLNTGQKRGFMLKHKTENPGDGYMVFWSKECVLASTPPFCNVDQVPYFEVEYKDNSVPTAPELQIPANGAVLTNSQVVFEASPATDPDGDSLEYRVVVAKDSGFTQIYKQSTWQPLPTIRLTIGVDGTYYWKVEVRDQYGNTNQSQVWAFTVDTTPPGVPAFMPEPPVTKGTTNTLYWYISPLEDNVTYQLEWDTSAQFTSPMDSGWIDSTSYTVKNLKEQKYYYRVRSRDKYGNISKWSKTVWSLQDFSNPKLVRFDVQPWALNPRSGKKIRVSVEFADVSLEKTGLVVYNQGGGLIYEKYYTRPTFTEYLDPTNWQDGTYFAYALAYDSLNNRTISFPKKFVLDSTPPKILGDPIKPSYKVNRPLAFSLGCSEDGKLLAKVSNRVYKGLWVKAHTLYTVPLKLKDGNYTVEFSCTDNLGNSTAVKTKISLDTTPPPAPKITVFKQSGKYYAKVSCSKQDKVYIKMGDFSQTSVCKSRSVTFELPSNLQKDTTYLIQAYRVDSFGNKGKASLANLHIPAPSAPPKAKPKIADCKATFKFNTITHTLEYKNIKCGMLEEPALIRQEAYYKNNLIYYDFYFTASPGANLKGEIYVCAQPFGMVFRRCVYATSHEFSASTPINYVASFAGTTAAAKYVPSKKYFKLHFGPFKSPVSGDLKIRGTVATNLRNQKPLMCGVPIVFDVVSKAFPVSIVPAKPVKATKPLAWIFRDYKNVRITQRFGVPTSTGKHGGVDFGVYKKLIIAPRQGKIVASRYDNPTSCRISGGWYIALYHPDIDLFTYYFHLNGLRVNGKKQYVGKWLNIGDPVAISGNSGKYKCHTLPYHLHYEVRTCRSTRCRKDPLKYTEVDWSKLN